MEIPQIQLSNLERSCNLVSIPNLIAIDGPAASGKSSIGQDISKKLGYLFLDTGIMYRAVTWAALDRKVPIDDEKRISDLARNIHIEIRQPSISDGRESDVLVDNVDVTWNIRETRVNDNVSAASAYPEVRVEMTKQQREIAKNGKIVMVGRDIGTVVLPEANLKIYLEASVEERAMRRFQEEIEHGRKTTYENILISMRKRDEIDSKRRVAPLIPAKDAIIIHTDGKKRSKVFEEILQLFNK